MTNPDTPDTDALETQHADAAWNADGRYAGVPYSGEEDAQCANDSRYLAILIGGVVVMLIVVGLIVGGSGGAATWGGTTTTTATKPPPHDYGSPFLNAIHTHGYPWRNLDWGGDDDIAIHNAHATCDDLAIRVHDLALRVKPQPPHEQLLQATYAEIDRLAPKIKMWPMSDKDAENGAGTFIDIATKYYCPQYELDPNSP